MVGPSDEGGRSVVEVPWRSLVTLRWSPRSPIVDAACPPAERAGVASGGVSAVWVCLVVEGVVSVVGSFECGGELPTTDDCDADSDAAEQTAHGHPSRVDKMDTSPKCRQPPGHENNRENVRDGELFRADELPR